MVIHLSVLIISQTSVGRGRLVWHCQTRLEAGWQWLSELSVACSRMATDGNSQKRPQTEWIDGSPTSARLESSGNDGRICYFCFSVGSTTNGSAASCPCVTGQRTLRALRECTRIYIYKFIPFERIFSLTEWGASVREGESRGKDGRRFLKLDPSALTRPLFFLIRHHMRPRARTRRRPFSFFLVLFFS